MRQRNKRQILLPPFNISVRTELTVVVRWIVFTLSPIYSLTAAFAVCMASLSCSIPSPVFTVLCTLRLSLREKADLHFCQVRSATSSNLTECDSSFIQILTASIHKINNEFSLAF